MKLYKFTVLLVTPILVIVLVNWVKSQNQIGKCYKLPTDTAVKICVQEYEAKMAKSRKVSPTPTIEVALVSDLTKIVPSNVEVYLHTPEVGVPYLKIKGSLTNNLTTDVNNIKIQVRTFNKTDDTSKMEPITSGEVIIGQTLHKGNKMSFDEVAIINPSGTKFTWKLISAEIDDIQVQIQNKLK